MYDLLNPTVTSSLITMQLCPSWAYPSLPFPCYVMCEHWIEDKEIHNSRLQGLPVSGNKQDLIERLQSSLLDEGDDLLDQVEP